MSRLTDREIEQFASWALERLGDDTGPSRLVIERQTLRHMEQLAEGPGELYPPGQLEVQRRLVELLAAKK